MDQFLNFFEPLSFIRERLYRRRKLSDRDFVKSSHEASKAPSTVPGTKWGSANACLRGVGRAAASNNNNTSGRMALATAADVAATFFFSLFVQMLPL